MNRFPHLLSLACGLVLGFGLMGIAEAGFTTAGIDIQKLVNGQDADVAPGPSVAVGSTVTFTYNVANHNLFFPIENVFVSDNNGTPLNVLDDFSPAFVSGDTSNLGVLDPGEVWTYTATSLALAGPYENIGTVQGILVFVDEEAEIELRIPVNALDLGHYFGTGTTQQVPEPATLLLLSAGLAGLGYRCRRRRQHS